MTCRDFVVVARIIHNLESSQLRTRIGKLFSTTFASMYTSFDPDKFEEACGIPVLWRDKGPKTAADQAAKGVGNVGP